MCTENEPTAKPGIYAIVQIETGKIYIGHSQNIEDRLKRHARKMSPKFLKTAISKYGREKFLVFPLYYSITNFDHVTELESKLIKEFNSLSPNGYNILEAQTPGLPYGPAFSALISEVQQRPDIKAKVAARWADPHERIKQSTKMREIMADPNLRARMSTMARIIHGTPEARSRASEKARAAHARSDVRANYDTALYKNPEVQERKRLAIIAALANHDRTTRKPRKDSVTGIKGVRMLGNKFRAQITINGKAKHLGVFSTIEEAHAAYLSAARSLKEIK